MSAMKPAQIAKLRLISQRVHDRDAVSPLELGKRMGAIQAQDYASSLWAIGARVKGATEKSVEDAVVKREIVRSWPMRRTLHFVPAADAKWMVELSAERVIASAATRARQLELDDKIFAKAAKVATKALEGGRQVTRDRLRDLFIKAGLPAQDSRASHLFWRLAQERLICFGAREGKQPTFVLLDEWVEAPNRPEREEAISILVERYFTSHGPATVKDFVWWAGLKASETKAALKGLGDQLEKVELDGVEHWMSPDTPKREAVCGAHLLPGFDEIVISYQDRLVTLAKEHAERIVPGGNGMFLPMVMDEGQVTGTWKRTLKAKSATVTIQPFRKLSKAKIAAIAKAAKIYGEFLNLPVVCEFQEVP
ncbi:MAG: winged helix DNA-binding protein, partial [Akkermansiaceae bacterium]|nr:winged helix DNA-binding protein [Akkermansiaceae bacterium]